MSSAEPIASAAARFSSAIMAVSTRRAQALALLVVWLFAAPAEAAPVAVEIDDAGREHIARIEAYLNGIRTMRSRFVQIASTGAVAEGDLYLSRPGRLRIEYRPPVPVEIVANNGWLVYHDTHLEQVSYVPVSSSPAGILVSETLSLTDGSLVCFGR